MELLIPGLILVGLMVYASTKIKKIAAKALESEKVETPDYAISKPEGFINVVSPDDGLLFRAYTKEFADEGASKFRKAEATIRVLRATDAARICDELKHFAGFDSYDTAAGRVVRVEAEDEGVSLIRMLKLIPKDGDVYQLRIDTPAECRDEYDPAIRELIDSFELR
jgi:hypothetical protein